MILDPYQFLLVWYDSHESHPTDRGFGTTGTLLAVIAVLLLLNLIVALIRDRSPGGRS